MIQQVMKLLHGETVIVYNTIQIGIDEFNAPIYEEVEETVNDVLVSPGTQNSVDSDVLDSMRPDGALVKYTLHFPKSYTNDLTHHYISVRGHKTKVIGSPDHYTPENTPFQYNMSVNVSVVDG